MQPWARPLPVLCHVTEKFSAEKLHDNALHILSTWHSVENMRIYSVGHSLCSIIGSDVLEHCDHQLSQTVLSHHTMLHSFYEFARWGVHQNPRLACVEKDKRKTDVHCNRNYAS